MFIINRLGSSNNIFLKWIPAHKGFIGNEVVDMIAKEGADDLFIGPEPYCGVPWCSLKSCLNEWLNEERQKYFLKTKGLKHSKRFIRNVDSKRAQNVLNLRRNDVRLVTAAFTGRYLLNDYLFKAGLSQSDKCRFCNVVKETMEHVLCECGVQCGTRHRNFGKDQIVPSELNQIKLKNIIKFLRDIGF